MVLIGELVSFSVRTNEGVIRHAGQRFTFTGAQWVSQAPPAERKRVQFEVDDGRVVSVKPETNDQRLQESLTQAKQVSGPLLKGLQSVLRVLIWTFVAVVVGAIVLAGIGLAMDSF
jgi:hypothetical protein